MPMSTTAKPMRMIDWLGAGPFVLIHLLAFGAIWTGITPAAAVCCVALYFIRMFAVTGGYHRYFSHRTYKTSRVFQFILAFLAQTSAEVAANIEASPVIDPLSVIAWPGSKTVSTRGMHSSGRHVFRSANHFSSAAIFGATARSARPTGGRAAKS